MKKNCGFSVKHFNINNIDAVKRRTNIVLILYFFITKLLIVLVNNIQSLSYIIKLFSKLLISRRKFKYDCSECDEAQCMQLMCMRV